MSAKTAPSGSVSVVPTIQIKDVPAEVHAVLHRRAAAAGQSLQEFVLGRLRDEARTPTVDELFERVSYRSGGRIGLKPAARLVRSDRDAR
jgi:hypothetical protein